MISSGGEGGQLGAVGNARREHTYIWQRQLVTAADSRRGNLAHLCVYFFFDDSNTASHTLCTGMASGGGNKGVKSPSNKGIICFGSAAAPELVHQVSILFADNYFGPDRRSKNQVRFCYSSCCILLYRIQLTHSLLRLFSHTVNTTIDLASARV